MRAIFVVTMLVVAVTTAHAAPKAFLESQWLEGANRMCKYTNGTVLNVGVGLCPLSI